MRQCVKFYAFRANHVARETGETDEHTINLEARIPLDNHAFIIDQLKRPEEIDTLVKVFGKRFVQVSVVTPLDRRKRTLDRAANRSIKHTVGLSADCKAHTDKLIDIDQHEREHEHGQRISKIFHRGDVFFNGASKETLDESSTRFVNAFFWQRMP